MSVPEVDQWPLTCTCMPQVRYEHPWKLITFDINSYPPVGKSRSFWPGRNPTYVKGPASLIGWGRGWVSGKIDLLFTSGA